MAKILNLCGMCVGGWLGWVIGARVGFFTAFIVSVVGSAAGLYAAIRVTRHFLA